MNAFPSATRELLIATRNAPTWVLRSIDTQFRRAGKPAFRAGRFAVLDKPRRLIDKGFGLIAGLAAYGVSTPTTCDYDTRLLPESFSPTAFRSSVMAINRGVESIWLAIGHNEHAIADTKSGGLHVRIDPRYGLEFWAKLGTSEEHRRVTRLARYGKLAVSVGFIPTEQESRMVGGKRHRLITRAELQHIALLDTTLAAPAYASSRVFHSWGTSSSAVVNTLRRARLAGFGSAVRLKLDRAAK
jgi:hypothetical protein